MKKAIAAMNLVACLLLSLGACKQAGVSALPSGTESQPAPSQIAPVSQADPATDSDYEGGLGDTLTNAFFAYTVNSATTAAEYGEETPAAGSKFLIADITVTNVFGEEIPMFSSDFQVQWGSGEKEFGYPVEKFSDELMDDEYTMEKGETITAKVVYEVPEDSSDYSISYLEIYENESEGDVYFVYFTA